VPAVRQDAGSGNLADRGGPRHHGSAHALIKDIARNGNEGIGKPEAPKHGFQGYWSRRITDEHRLVYKIAGDEIRIAACCYHYGK
jgi:toxin YoeB